MVSVFIFQTAASQQPQSNHTSKPATITHNNKEVALGISCEGVEIYEGCTRILPLESTPPCNFSSPVDNTTIVPSNV
jgi:hypothetical protein